jgi:hypothetical protein
MGLSGPLHVLIPTGYDYLFRPDKDWVMLPALFLGIALPGFLWLPIGRAIHGKRIRKYVLYMIARQKADTRPFIKWGCTPIALLAVVFAIQFARAHIGLIRDGAEVMLVQQGVFAIHPKQYALSDISAVYMVMRRRAPNGNVLERPYVAVTFEGSGVWTSEWWIGEPKGSDLTDLAARISHRTGLAVHPRILFGEDEIQKTQVSRP